MKVTKTHELSDAHSIEIGQATWNSDELSIRNRYKTEKGGFSPHSSSEIPVNDLEKIITISIRENLIKTDSLVRILKDISDKLYDNQTNK